MLIPAYSSSTCKHGSKQAIPNTGKVIRLTKAPLCRGWAPGASRSGRRRLSRDSSSECALSGSGVGECQTGGPRCIHDNTGAPCLRRLFNASGTCLHSHPSFLPYRFRIYLACIIVYFDPGTKQWAACHVLIPSHSFWFPPGELTLELHSLAAPLLPISGRVGPHVFGI